MTFDQGANRVQNLNFRASANAGYLEGLTLDDNNLAWIADSGSNQIISWLAPDEIRQYLPIMEK